MGSLNATVTKCLASKGRATRAHGHAPSMSTLPLPLRGWVPSPPTAVQRAAYTRRGVATCLRSRRIWPSCTVRPTRSVHTLIDAARYRPVPPGRRSAGFALVDAFAPELYTGNPAAIVRLVAFTELSTDAMQMIANEVGASATAFIAPAEDVEDTGTNSPVYDIRWFSVTQELPLCGHATVGAAKALLASGVHPPGTSVLFRSQMGGGNLVVSSDFDETLELDLPSLPPVPDPTLAAPDGALWPELSTGLGIDGSDPNIVLYVGRNKYDIVIELESSAAVESLSPNHALLETIDCRGVIVTAAGKGTQSPAHWPAADFVARFFGPSMGIPEDPATGSAQCALAPYWAQRLGKSNGLVGFQASRRGGSMTLALRRAGGEERVVLGSAAQVVVDGTITLPSSLD